MPDISTNATVNIEVNSQSVKRRLAELENQLSTLNKKKAEFERTGNTAGLVKVEKDIKKVNRQMNTARTNAQKCEAALKKLNSASPKELRMVLKQLQNDLNHIERGSDAWKRHVEAIKRVKAEIKTVDAELREHEGLLSRINRKVNDWGMSIASAAAAFTGIVFTARQSVQAYADMEGEMANVRKFTGMTEEDVAKLNEEFKKMDTRTSREDLNKLAQEAGRLGLQIQEDVLGFVKAANQINVALDDLGDGATLTLSKLTDIFGDKDRLGVEQSLLAVGSVINELSQNCTASAPYLAQFAQRLAGVGKQANMTIPQIMGFAAVLDSQGQAVEMSATALSQLIMKLFQDPTKIAKATGMDLQAFNKVLKEDTNEALLMLFQRLNELGDLSVLAPVFDAMGTDGVRASQVIAALAGNVAQIKWEQAEANKAFKEGTSVTKESNIQNNTVQAQLDKAKKGFHEMAVELGQKLAPAMKYAISGTSSLMHVLSTSISFISEYAGTIISTTAAIAAYTVIVNASTIAFQVQYYWVNYVIPAFKRLRTVISTNPYGALAAAMGVVIGLIIDFTRRANSAAAAQRALNNIQTEAKKKAIEQQQEIETLIAAANNLNLTYDEQKIAVDKLNKLIPQFNGKINATTRAFSYSKKALNDYNDQLVRLYELEGAKEKLKEIGRQKADKILERNRIKQQIEDEKKFQTDQEKNRTFWADILSYGNTNDPNPEATKETGKYIRTTQLASSLRSIDNELTILDNTVKAINQEYGTDLQKQALKQPTTPISDITSNGGYSNYNSPNGKTSAEEQKRQREVEAEEKKRKAEEEKQKRIAAALDKKELKDALELAKANLARQNNAALDAYNQGEIDYVTYLERKRKAAQEYYTAADKVYEKFGAKESEDAAKLREKSSEEEKKHKDELLKMIKEQYANERDLAKVAAQMEFYNPDNTEAYKNQRVLDEKLTQIDLEYLRKVLKAQTDGSQEYDATRKALEKAEREDELRKRKKLEEDLAAWLYIYSQKGAKERMEAELLVAKELHEKKKLNEQEYQEAVASIQKKYRDEANTKTGTKAKNQDFDDAKDTYEKQMAALEDLHNQGLLEDRDYESRKWQITQNYHNKAMELIKGQGSEWATMVTTLVETWQAGFEEMGSTAVEKMQTISAMAASAFAVMNAGIKSYSDYANASRDLELAKVEKNYQAQIDAAGNNEKKRKKLEEQKEKEIAKIKNKYNKQAMAVEMAQAVASTALAAINAYASAAKVPIIGYLLAPIAASMALAAGALQIATIKKSHQAQQLGYYRWLHQSGRKQPP